MVNIPELEQKARDIRRKTFEMVIKAGGGHLGGSFSCVECLVALYAGGIMKHDPGNPDWPQRDRFIFSKGHANNAYYVLLADQGYFPESALDGFLQTGSFLGSHIDQITPGVEVTSGSLGHGLGLTCGMALGAKISEEPMHFFTLMGDGETQEGSVWEAGMFAAQQGLDNLTVVLDRNRLGAEGPTEDSCGLDPLEAKWEAFGWTVKSIDGHALPAVMAAFDGCRERQDGKPLMIVINTIKGKGISSLENQPHSHHVLPKGDAVEQARRELA